MSDAQDDPVIERLRRELAGAVAALEQGGARDEALAEFVPPRRVLMINRQAAMRSLGRAWRLGVFLLDRAGALYAVGATTRAVPPGYPGYQSVSAEHRRDHRAAAFRGPFEHGETVNFDAHEILLDAEILRSSTGPLFLRGDDAFVRWSATAPDDAAIPFEKYLAERVDLLVHPPEGSS
ncbi:hypothetical protein [Diaminobutyricimonas sp. LJ205]|uniref:hypothetical protein n=1 Tax=Diaminobutyricimonas sp. LJ205 TaxID=2683590 RepID=UPI0012F4BF09|nr:hypothetical protein [Diaminobutyricimonas sp. LJ205]